MYYGMSFLTEGSGVILYCAHGPLRPGLIVNNCDVEMDLGRPFAFDASPFQQVRVLSFV